MFSFCVLFVNPCVLSLPRRVHLVEQVLVTLPEYLISPVVFSRVQLAQSSFCVVCCRSLFVLLSFFFWSLHCLSFFDLQLLITHLVSSNLRKLINFANTIICIQQVQYTSSDDIIFKLIIDTDCRFIHTKASSLLMKRGIWKYCYFKQIIYPHKTFRMYFMPGYKLKFGYNERIS